MTEIESKLHEFVTNQFAVDSLRLGMDLRDDLELSEEDIFEISSFAEDTWDIEIPTSLQWNCLDDLVQYIEENI